MKNEKNYKFVIFDLWEFVVFASQIDSMSRPWHL